MEYYPYGALLTITSLNPKNLILQQQYKLNVLSQSATTLLLDKMHGNPMRPFPYGVLSLRGPLLNQNKKSNIAQTI